MNERLKEDIAAWLDFYRELGIEDFFRREPGTLSNLEIRNSDAEPRNSPRPDGVSGKLETHPSPEPRMTTPEELVPTSAAPIQNPKLNADYSEETSKRRSASKIKNLNLFEAPALVRDHETLDQVREDLGDCQRCKLAKERKHIVFGQGNPSAQLVFVGEGPGADEDEQGLPFVGRAGKLLDRMLNSVEIKRQDVYICNVVKCRPPGNRTPEKDEVDSCSPFLFRQLDAIQPRLICCLGALAVRTVLGLKEGILKIRGRFYDYGAAKAMATVHPAYVLRNPREEKILQEDFEKIREFLKQPIE